MSEIPSAREYINSGLYDSGFEFNEAEIKILSKKLKEFAKLHVKAVLKAASEKALICGETSNINGLVSDKVYINKNSILNAYPLDLIK